MTAVAFYNTRIDGRTVLGGVRDRDRITTETEAVQNEKITRDDFEDTLKLADTQKRSDKEKTQERIPKEEEDKVISERDLTVCQERSACNIIHKRFWLPPVVERLCRCPHRNECPWSWLDGANQTIYINNRSQLKFCTELTNLQDCTQKKAAIAISTLLPDKSNTTKNHTALQNMDKHKRHSQHRNITITCYCQDPHYWKPKVNSSRFNAEKNISHQSYYCSKLKKCTRHDFCGFVRLDTHSTFYRCSCPKGHMCITKDKVVFHADEMLYNGDAYKAYCLPHKFKSR